MDKKTKFLNILTFGHLSRKAKKQAQQEAEMKKTELTLNTIGLPDINALANALGGITNIVNISATISTISIQLSQMEKIDLDYLKKISVKGVIKSADNVTLLVGDCAMLLKDKLLELKK